MARSPIPSASRKSRGSIGNSSRKVRFNSSLNIGNHTNSALSGIFKTAKKNNSLKASSSESGSGSGSDSEDDNDSVTDSSTDEDQEDQDLTLIEDAEAAERSGEIDTLVDGLDKEISSLDIDGKLPSGTKLSKEFYSQIKHLINAGPLALAQPSEHEVTKSLSIYQSVAAKTNQGISDLLDHSCDQLAEIQDDLKLLEELQEKQFQNRQAFEKKVSQIRKSFNLQKKEFDEAFEDDKRRLEPEIQAGKDFRSGVEKLRNTWKSHLDAF